MAFRGSGSQSGCASAAFQAGRLLVKQSFLVDNIIEKDK